MCSVTLTRSKSSVTTTTANITRLREMGALLRDPRCRLQGARVRREIHGSFLRGATEGHARASKTPSSKLFQHHFRFMPREKQYLNQKETAELLGLTSRQVS